jgi:hypothetical protein
VEAVTLVTLVEAGDAVGFSLRNMRRLVAAGYLKPVEAEPVLGGTVLWYDLAEVRKAAAAWRRDRPRGRPRWKNLDGESSRSA